MLMDENVNKFTLGGAILNNDNTLASAAIDRLVHHGMLVQIKGESYRVK